MIAIGLLFVRMLGDRFKSPGQLEVEILIAPAPAGKLRMIWLLRSWGYVKRNKNDAADAEARRNSLWRGRIATGRDLRRA